jgi:glutathione S-transferase
MKLYYSPAACSLSPHIVAREAGVPIELVKVDLKAHTLADGTDYTTINPKGSVPLLELDDGDRLSEGPAIVQYLADRNPAAGLAPAAGTTERYHLQEWLNFVTSELHKQYSPLFDAAVPAEYKETVKARLAQRLDWLSTRLAGQDYLTGAQFSVADAYLFTVLNWNRWVGLDTARWPVLEAYVARVGARPKVQEALRAEGLTR